MESPCLRWNARQEKKTSILPSIILSKGRKYQNSTRSTRETEILKKEGSESFLFGHSVRNSNCHKIVLVPLCWPLLGTPKSKSHLTLFHSPRLCRVVTLGVG